MPPPLLLLLSILFSTLIKLGFWVFFFSDLRSFSWWIWGKMYCPWLKFCLCTSDHVTVTELTAVHLGEEGGQHYCTPGPQWRVMYSMYSGGSSISPSLERNACPRLKCKQNDFHLKYRRRPPPLLACSLFSGSICYWKCLPKMSLPDLAGLGLWSFSNDSKSAADLCSK